MTNVNCIRNAIPWITCPECHVGRNEDHRKHCSRLKPPRLNNFSAEAATNRGVETMFTPWVPWADESGLIMIPVSGEE